MRLSSGIRLDSKERPGRAHDLARRYAPRSRPRERPAAFARPRAKRPSDISSSRQPMKSITVLLVGQVRNQHVLLRTVENLAAFRDKGLVNRVSLSTWTGEIPKISHLLPQLDAAGVTVKWVDEPVANLSAPGNIVNQMRGVDLALETVEDTAWVLRARPDLLVDRDLVSALAAADMSLAPGDS